LQYVELIKDTNIVDKARKKMGSIINI